MKSYFILLLLLLAVVVCIANGKRWHAHDDRCDKNSSSSSHAYNQLPHGQTTYDLDDGGCYFCSKFPGSTYPLEDYQELSDHCKTMCNADYKCTAYTIARPAILYPHEYYWGRSANCCLERETYPPEAFIHPRKDWAKAPDSSCDLESLCWTRYEKKCTDNNSTTTTTPSAEETEQQTRSLKRHREGSPLCKKVWKSRTYSHTEIQQQITFIANGCPYHDPVGRGNNTKYISLLEEAYDECKAEILNPQSIMNQNTSHSKQAWVAHGLLGFFTFGLFVPLSLFSSYFRDWLIPKHWLYLQSYINILTFITVAIAFGTMNGHMGNAEEGHTKEVHHIMGLLLLLLVCLQTAVNGYFYHPASSLRQSDSVSIDGEDDDEMHDTTRSSYYWQRTVNLAFGLLIFVIGATQIHLGMKLFTRRYDTLYYGNYFYISWLIVLLVCAWVRVRRRVVKFAAVSTTEVDVQELPPYDYDPRSHTIEEY